MIKKIITIGIIFTVLHTGCDTINTDNDNELKEITFVLDWLPNTNHTGIYAAIENGYYEEEGLSVKIVEPPEDGALSLIAAGKADFGVSFQEDIGMAITADEPLPVVAVAGILAHNTSGIISLKEKGILTPKDMEGHNYATWDTPIEKAILKDVMEKDGGDYEKLEKIPSTVTDVLSALQTDIDTIWIYYGWDGVAASAKGIETNFFYFKDLNPALDFYTPVIAASEQYLADNPELTKNFLKATARGYEYAIENPSEAADIICKYVPEIDRELAGLSQEYLSGQYKSEQPIWGVIDGERWDGFFKWLSDNGIIDEIESGKGFTNEYIVK